MRLSNFLVGAMVCALFAACTNDDNGVNDSTTQTNGEQAFIAVRLMAPSAMTRAFQNGSDAENAVTTARFYFFDNTGAAVTVSGGNNYINKESISFTPGSGNVEETSTAAIMVLENAAVWPTKMAVVLNPPTELTGSKSLTELRGAADDYASTTSFVMSSSVYLDGSNAKIDAIDITSNITNTSEAAQANPANVYVERVLARVDVKQNSSSLSGYSDDTEVDAGVIEGYTGTSTNAVTAVVKGWGLANRNKQSHLLKNLDAGWNDADGTTPFSGWNSATNFRSYWAQTSAINSSVLPNDSYSALSTEATTAMPTTKYCQERTNATTNPTELVVIAELQIDGTAATIAKYAGEYWTVDALLDQFLSMMPAIYYKASTGDPSGWTQIGKSQLKLRPGKTSETDVAAYEAVLDLKKAYTTGYEFASDASGSSTMELTAVQEQLDNFKALLWHGGKTYYHVPIEHNVGSASNLNGIVRNHLYQISISGITGLGTPIPGTSTSDDPDGEGEDEDPDPEDKPIDPEDPKDENSFLAAEINILSWNVVSQDVTLGQE